MHFHGGGIPEADKSFSRARSSGSIDGLGSLRSCSTTITGHAVLVESAVGNGQSAVSFGNRSELTHPEAGQNAAAFVDCPGAVGNISVREGMNACAVCVDNNSVGAIGPFAYNCLSAERRRLCGSSAAIGAGQIQNVEFLSHAQLAVVHEAQFNHAICGSHITVCIGPCGGIGHCAVKESYRSICTDGNIHDHQHIGQRKGAAFHDHGLALPLAEEFFCGGSSNGAGRFCKGGAYADFAFTEGKGLFHAPAIGNIQGAVLVEDHRRIKPETAGNCGNAVNDLPAHPAVAVLVSSYAGAIVIDGKIRGISIEPGAQQCSGIHICCGDCFCSAVALFEHDDCAAEIAGQSTVVIHGHSHGIAFHSNFHNTIAFGPGNLTGFAFHFQGTGSVFIQSKLDQHAEHFQHGFIHGHAVSFGAHRIPNARKTAFGSFAVINCSQ